MKLRYFLILFSFLLCVPSHAATPTYANNGAAGTNSASTTWGHTTPYTLNLPNLTGAGNALIGGCQWGATTGTVTVTDDKTNTWALVQSGHVSGNSTVAIYMATNIAASTQKVTFTFSANESFEQCAVYEFYNISTAAVASAVDKKANSSASASTTLAAGSFTPTTANDLLFEVVDQDSLGYVGTGTSPITAGTYSTTAQGACNWQILFGDPEEGFGVQYCAYNSTSAISATMTQSVAGTGNANAIAVLSAAAGTVPSATGIRMNNYGLCGMGTNNWATPLQCQLYAQGNLLLSAGVSSPADPFTGTTDSKSNTYTQAGSTISDGASGNVQFYYAQGATTAGLVSVKMGLSTTTSTSTYMVGDVSNAATTALDTTASATGTQSVSGNLTSAPSYTPGQQNEVIIAILGVDSNSVTGSTNATFLGAFIAPSGGSGGGQENNGWALLYNASSTSAQAFGWTTSGGALSNWAALAAGFEQVSSAGAPANQFPRVISGGAR